MTEDDLGLARAQCALMDVFLRRFEQLEEALGSAGVSVPSLDQQSIRVVEEWLAARSAERQAHLDDPRR